MITTTMTSKNKKLYGKPDSPRWKAWPIAATSRKIGLTDGGTCGSCMFLPKKDGGNGGCYAGQSTQGFVQRRAVHDDGDAARAAAFIKNLPQGWWIRLHVSGDFAINGAVDHEYLNAVVDAHRQRPDLTAWTYTHLWREISASTFADSNLTVRASCETEDEVRQAAALGWQTVMVGLSTETRKSWKADGQRYATCPEAIGGPACRYCGLCALSNNVTIVFPAHGSSIKAINASLTSLPMASD